MNYMRITWRGLLASPYYTIRETCWKLEVQACRYKSKGDLVVCILKGGQLDTLETENAANYQTLETRKLGRICQHDVRLARTLLTESCWYALGKLSPTSCHSGDLTRSKAGLNNLKLFEICLSGLME